MFRRVEILVAIIAVCSLTASAQTVTPCPGYNPSKNTTLSCELATGLRGTVQDANALAALSSIYVTMAGQLSQLPIAAAASGTGITIGVSGLPTVTTDSLGTILTQRGKTIGKHKLLLSFNFQRFGFQTMDGISLKDLPVILKPFSSNTTDLYLEDHSSVSFRVDQFTSLATFGLTNRIDVTVVVPFSRVDFNTGTVGTLLSVTKDQTTGAPVTLNTAPLSPNPLYFPGSANGIGDVRVNVKANVLGSESKTSVAIGSEVRFPSGDAVNFLGTGAYGFKPYLVISRRGRLTPNINIGYQWNGSSVLNFGNNLPGTFLYAGGVDFRATKRLTLTGEFLGQRVINGPRVALGSVSIPLAGAPRAAIQSFSESYSIDNASFGFKANPFNKFVISASAIVKLDDAGLRSPIVPLFGVAYRF